MITLVFMTDPQRVIGGSTWLRNMARMPLLPMSELPRAMDKVMEGKHMVIGAQSAFFYASKAANYQKSYLLTRNRQHPAASKGLLLCHDANVLINQYKDGKDELLVLGGLTAWKLFLPQAGRIRTVETYKNVPGDLVFKEWDDGSFRLEHEDRLEKLAVRTFLRNAN